MLFKSALCSGLFLLAALPSIASAGEVIVVGREMPTLQLLQLPRENTYNVVVFSRPIVAPGAVVDRDLSLQPSQPYLLEVQVVTQTTKIDMYADHRNHFVPSGLDSGHWIIRSAQMAEGIMHDSHVRTIKGSPAPTPQAQPQDGASKDNAADYNFILITPHLPVAPADGPRRTTSPIPTVPGAAKRPALIANLDALDCPIV